MNSNIRDVSLVTLTAFTELGEPHSGKYLHLSFTSLTQSEMFHLLHESFQAEHTHHSHTADIPAARSQKSFQEK